MSNLNVIVFRRFSIEQSTSVPLWTFSTTSFGMRSVDLLERRDDAADDGLVDDPELDDRWVDTDLVGSTKLAPVWADVEAEEEI